MVHYTVSEAMAEDILPGAVLRTVTSAAASEGFRSEATAGAARATATALGMAEHATRRLPPIATPQPPAGAAAAYHVSAASGGGDPGEGSRGRLRSTSKMTHARRLEHARASFSSTASPTTEEELKLVAPKRPLGIRRRIAAMVNGALRSSYEQKVSKRLKDQGVADWWTPLLNGEAYYSSESGATRHWDAAIEELKSQLDPQVDVEKAIENLEYRDAVGATVLHAAILTCGASKGVDQRKSERAFAVAKYLIRNFGPRQLADNWHKYRRDPSDQRTGVAIDLVNRAYYMDGDDQQYNGETALHMAIVYSDEKLVRMLLDAGASLSARCYGDFFKPSGPCYFGELPLSFAVSCGNLCIVYMLVDHVRNAPTRLARRVLNEWDHDLRKDELREKLLAGDSMPNLTLTGSIEFAAVQKPTRAEVTAAGHRFSRVTGSTLRKAGAQEYCWVPPASMTGAPDGGFLYEFTNGTYRLFPCADEKQGSKRAVAVGAEFPDAMVPLCLAPSDLYGRIRLNLQAQTWDAPLEGSGQVSKECEITLSSEMRTQAGIPKDADYFVWAYQDDQYNPDEAESESDFLEFGGFVYYKRTDQDVTVVGVLAPSLKLRHESAFGAKVDQTERKQGLEELVAMGWEEQKAEMILRKCGYMLSNAVPELIRLERQEVREEVTNQVFGELDADHNGIISRAEFERWVGDRDTGDTIVMQQKRVFQLLTQVDCLGNTALHMAVIHKRIEIFDWLLSPLTCTGCPRSEPKSIQDMLEENQVVLKELEENQGMLEEQCIAMSTPFVSQVQAETHERYDLMKKQEKKLTKQFDSNGDGKVTSREMQAGLAELYETGSSGQSRQARTKHHRGESDAERWAKTAVDNIDTDASGEIGAHEWSKWWWGGWWQKKLLERENSSALTALTLAALAGDEILFCHVLEAARVHKWSYGAVACHEMPLTQLDTLRSFDLPRHIRSPVAMKGDDDYDWKRSAMLIVLTEGVHAIADNKTLVDLQDAKWKNFAAAYFWLSLTLYSGAPKSFLHAGHFWWAGVGWGVSEAVICLGIGYVSLVWLLSFEYVAYSQVSVESSSAGDNVELPAGLRLWEWAVASMTVLGVVGFVFDYIGVMNAKKRQLTTIEQSRSQVKHDLMRAKQNSPLGPYFYDRPIWFSDGRIHAITREAIGHASKHQAFEHKQLEAYARVTDKWSPDPMKSTSMTEERRYIGPEEFTERLTFRLTNFQVLTIVRTALVMFFDDGQGNWLGMMSLGICAPIVHIQFFEWACGHRNNGHLIIVIERALKKDIKTFLIVLFVFILGFGQALYVLAVDTINDESSGDFARMVRSWLSLFRIATGEKPGWAKQNRDWDVFERSEVWHQDVEQTYIYLIFFVFVIIAAIVLLRLLISMFNETYNDVKKNRERIWRIQRGLFILTCERRLLLLAIIWDFLFFRLTHIKCFGHCNRLCCCVQSHDGAQVRASLGQRLVARMWVGDTIEVVDNVLHRHRVGEILVHGGLEVAAEAEANSPGRQESLHRAVQDCTVELRKIGVRANIITPGSETADLRIRFEGEIGKNSEEMKRRIVSALEPVLDVHHAGHGADRLTVQYDSDEPSPRVVPRDEIQNEAMHIALLRNPDLFRGREKDVEAERSAIKEALALLTKGEWTIRPGTHSLMLQQEAPPAGAETPSQVRIRQLQARESNRREATLLGQPRPI